MLQLRPAIKCGGKPLTLHDVLCAIVPSLLSTCEDVRVTGDVKEAAVGAWKRHTFDRFTRDQWRLYCGNAVPSVSATSHEDCKQIAGPSRSIQADLEGIKPFT